jgi:regulator of protease activity HflC (stomatin/prohibitin superfamily)
VGSGIVGVAVLAVLAGVYFLLRAVKIVREGHVGIVTRMGVFRRIQQPGRVMIVPVIDRVGTVDMRERSRAVLLTATSLDDRLVVVKATVVAQVVDAKLAYFSVANVDEAIDALAGAVFRSVIRKLSAADTLFARQSIAVDVQQQMNAPMEGWGSRILGIDDVEITEQRLDGDRA